MKSICLKALTFIEVLPIVNNMSFLQGHIWFLLSTKFVNSWGFSLSCNQHNLKISYWHYDYSIEFKYSTKLLMNVFVDVNWVSCSNNQHSTFSVCVFFGANPFI